METAWVFTRLATAECGLRLRGLSAWWRSSREVGVAACRGLLCDGVLSAGGDGLRVQRQRLGGFSLQVLTQQTPQLQVLLEEVVFLLPQRLPLQHGAVAPPQQRLKLRELAGLLVDEQQKVKGQR